MHFVAFDLSVALTLLEGAQPGRSTLIYCY
jgi:hypothetical protein